MTRLIRFYDGATPAPEATPSPAPEATPAIEPGAWRATLPAELKDSTALAKYATIEEAARGFDHAQRMLGRSSDQLIEMPKADDEAGARKVLERLGLPADLTGYKLSAPADAPEGFGPDQPLAATFLAAAHKAGVLPKQAQAVYEAVVGSMGAAFKAQEEQAGTYFAEAEAGLKSEWGQAYQQNIQAATYAVEKLGGTEFRSFLEDTGLAAEPLLLKAMAKVGKMLAEGDTGARDVGGQPANRFSSVLSPAEARARGQELLRSAMGEKNSAEAKRLNIEAQRYFKMAAGEATV